MTRVRSLVARVFDEPAGELALQWSEVEDALLFFPGKAVSQCGAQRLVGDLGLEQLVGRADAVRGGGSPASIKCRSAVTAQVSSPSDGAPDSPRARLRNGDDSRDGGSQVTMGLG